MPYGIEELRKVVVSGGQVVQGVDQLRSVDFKQVLKELLDLDDSELSAISGDFNQYFDLVNDELEAKVEAILAENGKYLLLVLRLLKLVGVNPVSAPVQPVAPAEG